MSASWSSGETDRDDRQPADELGDETELVQVFGQHLAEQVEVVALAVQRGAEADARACRRAGR